MHQSPVTWYGALAIVSLKASGGTHSSCITGNVFDHFMFFSCYILPTSSSFVAVYLPIKLSGFAWSIWNTVEKDGCYSVGSSYLFSSVSPGNVYKTKYNNSFIFTLWYSLSFKFTFYIGEIKKRVCQFIRMLKSRKCISVKRCAVRYIESPVMNWVAQILTVLYQPLTPELDHRRLTITTIQTILFQIKDFFPSRENHCILLRRAGKGTLSRLLKPPGYMKQNICCQNSYEGSRTVVYMNWQAIFSRSQTPSWAQSDTPLETWRLFHRLTFGRQQVTMTLSLPSTVKSP